MLYNCQIWSYTPHMTNNNTRWEGKASLGCINTYIRRGITVELCENRSQHRNPCGFAEAAYLNKAKYKEFVPWCPVSYPSPPSWVVGYYTRVSFKVKLTNGTNVKDRASSLLRPISKSCFLKQDN